MTFDQYFRKHARSAHFASHEFLAKGGAHNQPGSRAFQLNTDPPGNLWSNVLPLVVALNEIRRRAGIPISLSSVYRSPAYNRAIGGASRSLHMQFKAADIVSRLSPSRLAVIAREVRADGIFTGGIGVYRTFVHVDVRGHNVDF